MKEKHNSKFSLGFTMIELLVVVSIIGLLSAILLVTVTKTRKDARDTKRKADIFQVRKALEFYFQDNGTYPKNGTVGTPNNETDIQNLTSFLVPKYVSRLPNDPKASPENYQYVWGNNGQDYALLIPFSNDGDQDCVWRTPNGNANWFNPPGPIGPPLTCSYQ